MYSATPLGNVSSPFGPHGVPPAAALKSSVFTFMICGEKARRGSWKVTFQSTTCSGCSGTPTCRQRRDIWRQLGVGCTKCLSTTNDDGHCQPPVMIAGEVGDQRRRNDLNAIRRWSLRRAGKKGTARWPSVTACKDKQRVRPRDRSPSVVRWGVMFLSTIVSCGRAEVDRVVECAEFARHGSTGVDGLHRTDRPVGRGTSSTRGL